MKKHTASQCVRAILLFVSAMILLSAALALVLCGCERGGFGSDTASADGSDLSDTAYDNTSDGVETSTQGDINPELEIYSFSLLKGQNRNVSESVSFEISGDTISGTVSCVIDPQTLRGTVINIESNGARVEFEGGAQNADGTVNLLCGDGVFAVVYDEDGGYKRYTVKTEYIPTLLPIVRIDTGGETIDSKEEYKEALISIDCENADGFESLSDTPVKIRGRGNSTWAWEKKPYQIKFSVKTEVLGMSAAKRWVLLANYNDKSLIRNNVAFAMAEQLSFEYTPRQYPVDVFINGEYMGVYTLGEKVEAVNGRIELEEGDGADCGMLIEMGGKEDGDLEGLDYFHLNTLKYMSVISPDEDDRTYERTAYIKQYMQKAENAVTSLDGYDEYIDIDSLIDWLIITELTYNLDGCFRRSCYFTKDAGGRLKMGPVWDFDTAFGNMYKDYGNYNAWASLSQDKGYIRDNWITYLMRDSSFRARFRARWEEKKNLLLKTALDTIDSLYSDISRSAEYNFKRWDILDRVVGCEPSFVTDYNSYELQIEYLREFIKNRWSFIDGNI